MIVDLALTDMTENMNFPLLGEPLSVDLVNTRMRSRGADVDLLGTTLALNAWLKIQGHRIAWTGRASASDLRAVLALREVLDALLRAHCEARRPAAAALQMFNRTLRSQSPQAQLTWPPSGPRPATLATASRRKTLLHQLALDALEVLTGPQAGLLRKCANPDCILLFIADNPRRRWCSSAVCGNRARVSRHYQHQRSH